ncbi:MAG TPA: hypothetical protein VGQ62_24555, partial [Chloroflexota bacterium]|nr:hypothetical protein [Chloroflexota bacterium]
SISSDPVDASRLWLVTLLLAVAVLQLTRKIPGLIPGYPGGGGGGPSLGTLRQVTSLIRAASPGKSASAPNRGGR